jgi:hypothetical protein
MISARLRHLLQRRLRNVFLQPFRSSGSSAASHAHSTKGGDVLKLYPPRGSVTAEDRGIAARGGRSGEAR